MSVKIVKQPTDDIIKATNIRHRSCAKSTNQFKKLLNMIIVNKIID